MKKKTLCWMGLFSAIVASGCGEKSPEGFALVSFGFGGAASRLHELKIGPSLDPLSPYFGAVCQAQKLSVVAMAPDLIPPPMVSFLPNVETSGASGTEVLSGTGGQMMIKKGKGRGFIALGSVQWDGSSACGPADYSKAIFGGVPPVDINGPMEIPINALVASNPLDAGPSSTAPIQPFVEIFYVWAGGTGTGTGPGTASWVEVTDMQTGVILRRNNLSGTNLHNGSNYIGPLPPGRFVNVRIYIDYSPTPLCSDYAIQTPGPGQGVPTFTFDETRQQPC